MNFSYSYVGGIITLYVDQKAVYGSTYQFLSSLYIFKCVWIESLPYK